MKWVIWGLLSLLALGGPLYAIPFDLADLSGFRTSSLGDGITAAEDWNEGGFSFSWTISQDLDAWEYSYRIQATRKGISHILLEVSSEFEFAQDLRDFAGGIWEAPPPGGWAAQQGNPDLPVATFHGFKAEPEAGSELDWAFSFTSPRAPMWGSFYTKDGKSGGEDVTAWNSGLGTSSGNARDYVAVPDSAAAVPEAGPVILLGGGWLIGYLLRRKGKKESVLSP